MNTNTRKYLEQRKKHKNLPYAFNGVDSDLSQNLNAKRENSIPSGDRARLASLDAWELLNTRR